LLRKINFCVTQFLIKLVFYFLNLNHVFDLTCSFGLHKVHKPPVPFPSRNTYNELSQTIIATIKQKDLQRIESFITKTLQPSSSTLSSIQWWTIRAISTIVDDTNLFVHVCNNYIFELTLYPQIYHSITYALLQKSQRLEFLGDSVINMVVTNMLFHKYPDHQEGNLTKLKNNIVSNVSLATIVKQLPCYEELFQPKFHRLFLNLYQNNAIMRQQSITSQPIVDDINSRTKAKTNDNTVHHDQETAHQDITQQEQEVILNRKQLANWFEILIGCMYLQLGMDIVKPFLETIVEKNWEMIAIQVETNIICRVNEFFQKRYKCTPHFVLVNEEELRDLAAYKTKGFHYVMCVCFHPHEKPDLEQSKQVQTLQSLDDIYAAIYASYDTTQDDVVFFHKSESEPVTDVHNHKCTTYVLAKGEAYTNKKDAKVNVCKEFWNHFMETQ